MYWFVFVMKHEAHEAADAEQEHDVMFSEPITVLNISLFSFTVINLQLLVWFATLLCGDGPWSLHQRKVIHQLGQAASPVWLKGQNSRVLKVNVPQLQGQEDDSFLLSSFEQSFAVLFRAAASFLLTAWSVLGPHKKMVCVLSRVLKEETTYLRLSVPVSCSVKHSVLA